jgi:hypothetical protein
LDLAEESGARVDAFYARLIQGLAAWRSGANLAARKCPEETLVEAEELENPFGQATNRTYLGLVLESSDDPDGIPASVCIIGSARVFLCVQLLGSLQMGGWFF